jgi:hypothetical protein
MSVSEKFDPSWAHREETNQMDKIFYKMAEQFSVMLNGWRTGLEPPNHFSFYTA